MIALLFSLFPALSEPPQAAAASVPGQEPGAAGEPVGPVDLGDAFRVPEGFEVSRWAESPLLYNPTAMDVDARGRLWVTEAVNYRKWGGRNPGREHPEGDRVVILEDTDGDGAADHSKVFVQDPDLVAPLGICVLGDRVYVSCSPHLFVYVDEDGDDVPDRRETFLTGFGGFDHDHGLHSVVYGPDGSLTFNAGNAGPHLVTDAAGWRLRSGSLYNGGGPSTADNKPGLVSDDGRVWTGGLVLRVEEDATGLGVLAHNFRNNYEVALDSFGNLYQSDNDDDGNESCRFLWCMEGGNHGYFSADGSRTWSFDRRLGQKTQRAHWHQDDPGVVPAGTITGAGGPTGVCVYEFDASEGRRRPRLQGCVLAADAGAGCVYAFLPRPSGAGIVLEKGVLIEPLAGGEGERSRWFRPSDVAVAPDGSILVADWYDPGVGGHLAGDREAYGRILRLVQPRLSITIRDAESGLHQDVFDLLSPVGSVRQRARARLIEAGEEAIPALLVLRRQGIPWQWARAIWVLAELGEAGRKLVARELDHADGEVAAAAYRALRRVGAKQHLDPGRLARSPHAALRREVALDLRDAPLEGNLGVFLELAMRVQDRYSLEAFGIAAEGKEESLFAELAKSFGDAPERWSPAFERLAWRLHPLAAVPGFAARAADPSLSPGARIRAVDALAFVPERAAADAMATLSLTGPEDVRPRAAEWLEHRDGNLWRSFRMLRELPSSGPEEGEEVWSSGLVQRGAHAVDVSLGTADRLWLVVTDGADGNACDWADWIEPKLWNGERSLSLTEHGWSEARAEWGSVRVGANAGGGPIRVDGESFADAIGTHAASEIAFAVPVGFDRFTARVAVDDGGTSQPGAPTSVEFRVLVERPAEDDRLRVLRAALEAGSVEAARELALDPEGGMLLVHRAQKDRLTKEQREEAAAGIFRNPDLAVRALASEHFRRPGEGRAFPPIAELLRLPGDPVRGRELFFDPRSGCAQCHTVERGGFPRGGDVGPELSRIAEKLGPEGLFDAILNPSAGIAFGYDTWVVEDVDGRLFSGFLLADGEDLVLKDTQGVRQVIPKERVADRVKQRLSTMPEGQASGLEPGELADLVAFLGEDPGREPELGPVVELFDGEGLAGWTCHLDEPSARLEDVWSVEQGVLVCRGSPIGYLRTEAEYESFVLELEWRFDPEKGPGNSGVLLRVHGEDQVWPRSIEAQLMHRNAGDLWNIGGFPMAVDAARTRGRHTTRAEPSSEGELGEWNHYRITLDRGRLTLAVNGVVQNRAAWCEVRPGWVALQSEGAEIHFRNVRLWPIVN